MPVHRKTLSIQKYLKIRDDPSRRHLVNWTTCIRVSGEPSKIVVSFLDVCKGYVKAIFRDGSSTIYDENTMIILGRLP